MEIPVQVTMTLNIDVDAFTSKLNQALSAAASRASGRAAPLRQVNDARSTEKRARVERAKGAILLSLRTPAFQADLIVQHSAAFGRNAVIQAVRELHADDRIRVSPEGTYYVTPVAVDVAPTRGE